LTLFGNLYSISFLFPFDYCCEIVIPSVATCYLQKNNHLADARRRSFYITHFDQYIKKKRLPKEEKKRKRLTHKINGTIKTLQ